MGSVLGGPQTVNTGQTQNTLQNINQASQQQQQQSMTAGEATAANPYAQQVGKQLTDLLQMNTMPLPLTAQEIVSTGEISNLLPQFYNQIGQGYGYTNQGANIIGQAPALVQQGAGILGQAPGLINQGAGFMTQSGQAAAAPISGEDVAGFYNPFASNVTANLQDIFGQQNLANRIGATAQSGGVGASRAAVGQALLAQKQGLTAGGVYADLYQRALQAAQQQKAQQVGGLLGAGTGLVGAGGALGGVGAQFGGLGGTLAGIGQGLGNLGLQTVGTGIAGQQLGLQGAQYQAQRLAAPGAASIAAYTGALPGLIGLGQTGLQTRDLTGTTTSTLAGQQTGFGTGTGQTTYPAPALLPQLAGLGLAGAGLFKLFGGNRGGRVPGYQDGGPVIDLSTSDYTDMTDAGGSDYGDNSDTINASDLDNRAQQAEQQLAQQKQRQRYAQQLKQLQRNMAIFQKAFPQPGAAQQRAAASQSISWPKTPWGFGMPTMQTGGAVAPNFGSRLPNSAAAWTQSAIPRAAWPTAPANPAPYVQPMNYGNLFAAARSPFMSLGRRFQEGGAVTPADAVPPPPPDPMSTFNQQMYGGEGYGGLPGWHGAPLPVAPAAPAATDITAATFQPISGGGFQNPYTSAPGVGGMAPASSAFTSALASPLVQRALQGPDAPRLSYYLQQLNEPNILRDPTAAFNNIRGFIRKQGGRVYQEGGSVNDDDGGDGDGAEPAGLPWLDDDSDHEEAAGLPLTSDVPLPRARPSGDIEGKETGAPTFGAGRGYGGLRGLGLGANTAGTTSPYMALMHAGLGMLAASGQRDARGLPMSPLGAVGAGGMAGVQAFERGQQQNAAMDLKRQSLLRQNLALADLMRHRRAIEGRADKPIKMFDYNKGVEYLYYPESGRTVIPGTAAAAATPAASTTTADATSTPFEPTEQTQIPETAKPAEGIGDVGAFEQDTKGPIKTESWQNEKALEGLPDSTANMIKGIAAGRIKPPSMSRLNPRNQWLRDKVMEYDPNWDETAFARRQRTMNEFAVGARYGSNIVAMNTLANHMEKYRKLTALLDRGSFVPWNQLQNEAAKIGLPGFKSKQDLLGEIEVTQKGIADEAAKVFAGGGVAALEDRRTWFDKFDPKRAKSTLNQEMRGLTDMVFGRLDALAGQYNEGTRTSHRPMEFLTPATRRIYKEMTAEGTARGHTFEPTRGGAPATDQKRQEALDWIEANPNDSRVPLVKKKLGIQ